MKDLEKLNRVIDGLEHCCKKIGDRYEAVCVSSNENCPFEGKREVPVGHGDCLDTMFIETLSILRELTQPRVLQLDEMAGWQFVWLEDKGKFTILPGIHIETTHHNALGYQRRFVTARGTTICAYESEYNIRWRCWTLKPDFDQRNAVAWGGTE
mgnify:CR=1 FL=1